jgi:methylamine---glutamate N-methyltransferase subunit B
VKTDPHGEMPVSPPIPVPELRDYHQINAELLRRLSLGQRYLRLEGVEGQRLLILRLAGSWQAVIEVDGNAGPELAAEMDAPGVTVVCRGSAADGAGRDLRAGKLLILGRAGPVLGYFQHGGVIVAAGDVGARAGLCQRGGSLILLGNLGPLVGERQSGGSIFLKDGPIVPNAGHGACGGRLIRLQAEPLDLSGVDGDDRAVIASALDLLKEFMPPA